MSGGVGPVAHLVPLADVLADVLGVEEQDPLAEDAGVVHQLDDLLAEVAEHLAVPGQGQPVLVRHVLPQAGHLVHLVTHAAEHLDLQLGVIAHPLARLQFARFF